MNPFTKSMMFTALAVVLAGTVGFFLAPRPQHRTAIEQGRFLVNAMGCNDCHTPLKMGEHGPAPDTARLLSGHPADQVMPEAPAASAAWPTAVAATMTAWSGPWGVSFTANLTPDPDTGLGRWTADEFIATLRTGRHLGRGRQILPPMPYQTIGQLDDDDLKAMFAYLQSIPAIRNPVPQPLPPKGM